jgi:surface carbohydrate biosynthesis protein
MSRLNVLFPVETINRELDFRLFLAVMLANRRNTIFVGQHDVIHSMALHMRGGVYIGKNVFPRGLAGQENSDRHRALKEHDFVVVYLDEEGGIFRGDRDEGWARALQSQMDVRRLEADDYLCAWGHFQRTMYESLEPRCVQNIRTTGHPRFDLYKPQYRHYYSPAIERIRQRYGPFILINTNLSLANPGPGIEYSFSLANGWDVTNPETRVRHIAEYSYLCSVLHSFLSLTNRLSLEFPEVNVVIRPHPTEDFEFYSKIFAGVPNVHAVHDGPVAPWLLACEALVHNGCTTGIEAHLGGARVIAYRNPVHTDFEPYLPNTLGLTCNDEDSVVRALKAVLRRAPITQETVSERALSLLENLRADSFEAVRAVYEEAESANRGPGQFDARAFFLRDRIRAVKRRARRQLRPYVPKRLMRNRLSPRWIRSFEQMFYGFREDELRQRLDTVTRLQNKHARLRFHSPELFSVDAE